MIKDAFGVNEIRIAIVVNKEFKFKLTSHEINNRYYPETHLTLNQDKWKHVKVGKTSTAY